MAMPEQRTESTTVLPPREGQEKECPYCGQPMKEVRGLSKRGWHCEKCAYSRVVIGEGGGMGVWRYGSVGEGDGC